MKAPLVLLLVSIQLMSPASGDKKISNGHTEVSPVSIQLMSPASGDADGLVSEGKLSSVVSIQLMSPASGDQFKSY